MVPFSNLFGFSFNSGRPSSRRSTHSSYGYEPSSRNDSYGGYDASRLAGPFDMPYGDYTSSPRRQESSSLYLGRAASQRERHDGWYNYRDLSPIRPSERPRALTRKHAFNDHRSVSPLGTCRFEQPSRTAGLFSTSNMGGSLSDRVSRPAYASSSRDTSRSTFFEIDRGYDGYERPPASGGLFRSSAVRVDDAPRRMGEDGEYGSMLGRERRPNVGPNFRDGGLNWSDF